MRLFGIAEAHHYCSNFNRSSGDAEKSIEDYRKNCLGTRKRTLVEGTPLFNQYRDCSLREVERSLFFAASNYRRSLEQMISSIRHFHPSPPVIRPRFFHRQNRAPGTGALPCTHPDPVPEGLFPF